MKLIILSIFLFLCSLPSNASSYDLKLVTGDNRPPYSDRTLHMNGLSSLLASWIMKESKVRYSISWRPWIRGLFETDTGVFDVAFPYTITRERVKNFYFSNPLYSIDNIILIPSSIMNMKDHARLGHTKICMPKYFSKQVLENSSKNFNFVVITRDNEFSCLQLLKSKKVDGILTSRTMAKSFIKKKNHSNDYKISKLVLASTKKYFLVSKSNPNAREIIRSINISIEKLIASGNYHRLISQYPL